MTEKRPKDDDPDSRLAMVLLRYWRGWWEQAKLVVAARFHKSQVAMWDRGERNVPPYALFKTADATGFPRHLLGAVLRVIRSFRLAAAGKSRPGKVLAEVSLVELFPLAGQALDLILDPLSADRVQEPAEPSPRDHEEAEGLWRRLERRTWAQRWFLVEHVIELQNWALAVRVTAESLAAVPNRPKESLELARLALRIAERVGGSQEWRWRIQGYCGGILCNSLRACNDLPAARDARTRARKLWEDGALGDPGLLNEAMLPWIEAAYHRAQREFPQARNRIEEALELDSGELRGKILLTKANIHDTLGEPEASTAAILEALPHIDAEREPRLAWGARFNLLVDLIHLGRAEEARQRLPEVRRLAEKLGGELDLQRVGWLEGKIAYGLGDLAEARNRFEQVRRAFDKPELSYDYALVSMELSQVLLEQGETARVRATAEEMFSIFRRQDVPVEALKALRIFCEAARQETATVELARRIVRYLYRAQSDPELRFEEAGAE
jgi:tetratricopeptide (TPR) repeat protein